MEEQRSLLLLDNTCSVFHCRVSYGHHISSLQAKSHLLWSWLIYQGRPHLLWLRHLPYTIDWPAYLSSLPIAYSWSILNLVPLIFLHNHTKNRCSCTLLFCSLPFSSQIPFPTHLLAKPTHLFSQLLLAPKLYVLYFLAASTASVWQDFSLSSPLQSSLLSYCYWLCLRLWWLCLQAILEY